MDEEMLIKLVRAHKELYDLNDPRYDVRPKRDAAWQQIAAAMKQSPRDCRDQWKRIRDCYRRAQKLRRIKSIQGAKMIKRPKYEPLLSFLNPFLRDTQLRPDSPQSSNDEDSSIELAEAASPGTSRDSGSMLVLGGPHSSATAAAFHSVCVEPVLVPEPAVLVPETAASPPPPPPPAPLDAPAYYPRRDKITDFFMGLIETVKEFPEDIQIRVKREIFKVVSDAEELVFNMKSEENQLNGLGFVKRDQE